MVHGSISTPGRGLDIESVQFFVGLGWVNENGPTGISALACMDV